METMTEKITRAIMDCQAGRTERFADIYDAFAKPLYSFIYQKTFSRETAEDLTSKTFLSALKSIKSFDSGKASFTTWLYRIARNNVIDHYRTSHDDLDIESIIDLHGQSDLEIDIANKLLLDEVRKCLANLEPRQRSIVTMRLWDGLSYKEIAGIHGITSDNAKMIFSRALAKLRSDTVQLLAYALFLISNI